MKHKIKKITIALFSGIFILVILVFGTTKIIKNIIIDTNEDSIKELASHDKKVLMNTLDTYWTYLDFITLSMNKAKIVNDKDIINTLQSVNSLTKESITSIVSLDGTMYSSDGVIGSNQHILNILQEQNNKFAVYYDDKYTSAPEGRKEYLLVGQKVDNFYINGKQFIFMYTQFGINSLDDEFKVDSYGGKGFSSLIDSNGSYIVNINRTANVKKRDNFYSSLNLANDDINILKSKLIDNDEGITFNAKINDVNYLFYIVKLDDTNWNFVSQVPINTFSSLTAKLTIICFSLIFIILLILLCVFLYETKSIKEREKNELIYRMNLSTALENANIANKAKTDFLNNISHDIRTPMNAIIGYTDLAINHLDNKELTLGYLKKISASSDHLLRLINDVLDMGTIESGKIVLDNKCENLNDIIASVKMIVNAGIEAKKQKLYTNISIKNQLIICDKVKLSQILVNVISNSIKYTDIGGIISLNIREIFIENKHYYEFLISDDGAGIEEKYMKSLFEPFTREQTSTINKIQGTGLGLAITKSLVEIMNGTIACQSKKGEGTTFKIRIPFLTSSPYLYDNGNDLIENKGLLNGKRILLVEDNPMNQEIVKTIMEDEGVSVIVANNGEECLDIIKNDKSFDVILMDILMPVMDGYLATKKIRSLDDDYYKNVLIIAMSANAFNEDSNKALELGMNGYITKPVKADYLIKYLKNILI